VAKPKSKNSSRKPAAPARKVAAKKSAKPAPSKKVAPKVISSKTAAASKKTAEKLSDKKAAKRPSIIQNVKIVASKPSKSNTPPASAPKMQFQPAKVEKKSRIEPEPPQNIPAPVPTDAKPRKNQAGLNSRDLEHFRQLLLAKRRELVGDMSSMEREALRSTSGSNLSNLPMHMADMGTDNYEQEFTLGLVEKDRVLLREINSALAKIQDGTYGICEGTGKPIGKARLEAKPWARHGIEYARKMENGMVR
jgi:DnaK suppressor protein